MTRTAELETVDLGGGLGYGSVPFYSLEEPVFSPEVRASRPAQVFNVADAIGQTLEAFSDLGLVQDTASATESITAKMIGLNKSLAATPEALNGSELLPIVSFDVDDDDFTLEALSERFELGRAVYPDDEYHVSVRRGLSTWESYTAADFNSRTLDGQTPYEPRARSYPLAMVSNHKDGGVWYAGKRPQENPERIAEDLSRFDEEHPSLRMLVANPVDYLIANAVRRVRGEKLLDAGFTPIRPRTLFMGMPRAEVEFETRSDNIGYVTPMAEAKTRRSAVEFGFLSSRDTIRGTEGIRKILAPAIS